MTPVRAGSSDGSARDDIMTCSSDPPASFEETLSSRRVNIKDSNEGEGQIHYLANRKANDLMIQDRNKLRQGSSFSGGTFTPRQREGATAPEESERGEERERWMASRVRFLLRARRVSSVWPSATLICKSRKHGQGSVLLPLEWNPAPKLGACNWSTIVLAPNPSNLRLVREFPPGRPTRVLT